MSTKSDLETLLTRAGVKPYRRYGKIRVAHDAGTPDMTLNVAVKAVDVATRCERIDWPEYSLAEMREWNRLGLKVRDVCDDPQPALEEVNAKLILGLCERYHFQLSVSDGKLVPVPNAGEDMDKIRPFLPLWFGPMCRQHMASLIQTLTDAGAVS